MHQATAKYIKWQYYIPNNFIQNLPNGSEVHIPKVSISRSSKLYQKLVFWCEKSICQPWSQKGLANESFKYISSMPQIHTITMQLPTYVEQQCCNVNRPKILHRGLDSNPRSSVDRRDDHPGQKYKSLFGVFVVKIRNININLVTLCRYATSTHNQTF
jgi:hypothetical protein